MYDLLAKVIVGVLVFLAVILALVVEVCRLHGKGRACDIPQPSHSRSQGGKGSMPTAETAAQREELIKKLESNRQKAEELKGYQIYSKLFYELAQPFQYLAGMAAVWPKGKDKPTEEWATIQVLQNTLKMSVIYKIDNALEKYNATFDNGRLILEVAEPGHTVDINKVNSREWSNQDIARFTRQYEADIRERQIWVRHKALVEDLGNVCELILALKEQPSYDTSKVCELTGKMEKILEKYGIIFMFYEDERLRDKPQLRNRFVRVTDIQLKYPALMIKKDDSYEQFGTFAGTCREE